MKIQKGFILIITAVVIIGLGYYAFNQRAQEPGTTEVGQEGGYAIQLGDQRAGSITTTVRYVHLTQPGYVWLTVPDTYESNYSLGVSSLLSAGEHYNVVISHRDPEADAYRPGQQVTANLYMDNGSKVGALDLDDDRVLTSDGKPLTDTVTVN